MCELGVDVAEPEVEPQVVEQAELDFGIESGEARVPLEELRDEESVDDLFGEAGEDEVVDAVVEEVDFPQGSVRAMADADVDAVAELALEIRVADLKG